MNSFERIGEAQMLAYEGQQQIASALLRGLGRVLAKLLDRFLPHGRMTPW